MCTRNGELLPGQSFLTMMQELFAGCLDMMLIQLVQVSLEKSINYAYTVDGMYMHNCIGTALLYLESNASIPCLSHE